MTSIRLACAEDHEAIFRVNAAAFPTPAEARLVERLVAHGHDELALVAIEAGEIVGHLLFSPVTLEQSGRVVAEGLGLAPIAVLPAQQRRGIGSGLIHTALEALAAAGCPFVVVLGEPAYYRRFGFVTASAHGLANEYGVDEPFMVLELVPDSLPPSGGLVKYGPEFAEL